MTHFQPLRSRFRGATRWVDSRLSLLRLRRGGMGCALVLVRAGKNSLGVGCVTLQEMVGVALRCGVVYCRLPGMQVVRGVVCRVCGVGRLRRFTAIPRKKLQCILNVLDFNLVCTIGALLIVAASLET
ncbi:hypothetical protein M3J09_010234 [Ascochyta lentis]